MSKQEINESLFLDAETTKVLKSFLNHINSIFTDGDIIPKAIFKELISHTQSEYHILKKAVRE